MPDLGKDLTLEAIREYIGWQPEMRSERKAYNFAIISTPNGSYLGGCGLTQINWQHRFANLYYWVRSSQTRHGVATMAARKLAQHGFEILDLQRVEIVMATSNIASIRVAEKMGATREGLLRSRLNLHGAIEDAYLYSLIPADCL
jgi:ribosomal-protein-serine acetyltransferase